MACYLLAPNFGTISETVVSSANFHMADREFVGVRSFIMTRKSHGPMWVPCGIPVGDWSELGETNRAELDTLGSLRNPVENGRFNS